MFCDIYETFAILTILLKAYRKKTMCVHKKSAYEVYS